MDVIFKNWAVFTILRHLPTHLKYKFSDMFYAVLCNLTAAHLPSLTLGYFPPLTVLHVASRPPFSSAKLSHSCMLLVSV